MTEDKLDLETLVRTAKADVQSASQALANADWKSFGRGSVKGFGVGISTVLLAGFALPTTFRKTYSEANNLEKDDCTVRGAGWSLGFLTGILTGAGLLFGTEKWLYWYDPRLFLYVLPSVIDIVPCTQAGSLLYEVARLYLKSVSMRNDENHTYD